MNGRGKVAKFFATLGCLVLLAGAVLHLIAAYPRVSFGLARSNISPGLQSALRTVFLLVGWDWIVIAVIVLIAVSAATSLRKVIVLFCGLALLVDAAVMLAFIGWFVGAVMILASALLILCGGSLVDPPRGSRECVG